MIGEIDIAGMKEALTETRVTLETTAVGIERIVDMRVVPTSELRTLECLISEAIEALERLQPMINEADTQELVS